ncbi:MAG TPA: FtsX-like permease family protein [Gammaproteobacteria bacterium]|nr:FtsX-like permease family protein [Gammaproteobacteria bacterium]
MLELKLALRLFSRDWRSGELRILTASLLIAIGGLTATSVVVDRVERGMTRETNQILGADRVMSSSYPLDAQLLAQTRDFDLARSDGLRFSTMVLAGENFQLSSVRAVDASYPLAGQLRIAQAPYATGHPITGGPPPGEVWLAARLLHLLDVAIGDRIGIGNADFRVGGVIDMEPGDIDLIDFAPHLIMNLRDVAATGVVQPGSRVRYRYDFAGPETALAAFDLWSKSLDKSINVIGGEKGAPAVESALGRARHYLNLSGLLSLLLGAVAIAIASNRFMRRHFDHAALLRCLGLRQNQILAVYGLLLAVAALIGTLAGITLGYLAQHGIIAALSGLLPAQLPGIGAGAALLGCVTGLVTVAGFALPGLLRIRAVTPLRVLRKDLAPLPMGGWLAMLVSMLTLGAVMSWYTLDPLLVTVVLAGGLGLTAILMGCSWMLLQGAQRLARHAIIALRFGLGHLLRHREASLAQIAAFSVILMLISTLYLVHGELLSDWQRQLPEHAPNHFVINLAPSETEPFRHFLQERNIPAARMYPMVRGRITAVNGKTPAEVYGEDYEQLHNSLRRELNLTWTAELPEDNRLVRGAWNMRQQNRISIEEEMAQTLKLKPGDTLTFNIGGFETSAAIESVRAVNWDSFKPNFYVIFPPGALENMGASYITSFYLPPERKPLLNELLEQFPTVSVIEFDRVLAQVRQVMEQASHAIQLMLLFVIAAGLAVLLATVYSTLDEKIYETGLLRTLGAGGGFIRACTVTEYWVLGLLAGTMAAGGGEAIAGALYHYVFKIDARWHAWLWFGAPLLGILLVVPAGLWGTRRVTRVAPHRILQQ